jgi:predicted negative regulator of RcsB-dependent stress response
MANTFDLEEQEQLEQLKHFWKRYGNLITWVAIVILGGFTAWNGWQYWQRQQALAASVLYDELERAVSGRQPERVAQALADLKNRYSRTVYAQQGALLAARGQFVAGQTDQAQASLEWAAQSSADEGLRAIARLRLAALALDQKQFDAAAKWLADGIPPEFEGLAADRLGDVYRAQGQTEQAKAAYLKALGRMDERTDYRRLVEVKLNALGVDPSANANP